MRNLLPLILLLMSVVTFGAPRAVERTVRHKVISADPITNPDKTYSTGERVGQILSFDPPATAPNGSTQFEGVQATFRDGTEIAFDLIFFDSLPEEVGGDAETVNMVDGEVAKVVGSYLFPSGSYINLGDSVTKRIATTEGQRTMKPGTDGKLHALLIHRGGPISFVSTESLILKLIFQKDE